MLMNRIPFSLGALHAFEAAARLGSFKAAATELALSPTAVSHRIRTLEAQLGKPLFERRTRAVVLTADGRLLAEAVSGSFAAIAAAAPALAAKLPAKPQNWPLLHLDWHKPQGAADWTAWAQAAGVPPHTMQGGTRYSDAGHLIQAALAGQGVALLGRSLLAEEFRLGLLQSVSDIILPGQPYYLCRAAHSPPLPAVRAAADWLSAQSAANGIQAA